jgi:hypothetical protein
MRLAATVIAVAEIHDKMRYTQLNGVKEREAEEA